MIALYRDQFESAKSAAARLLSSGAAASPGDFGRLFESHLAPWLVRETGKVEVASGDKASAVEGWGGSCVLMKPDFR